MLLSRERSLLKKVKIFEGTKIVGPVYIGKNTIIGNNNIIDTAISVRLLLDLVRIS